jgi:hypothetical protein
LLNNTLWPSDVNLVAGEDAESDLALLVIVGKGHEVGAAAALMLANAASNTLSANDNGRWPGHWGWYA